MNEVDVLTNLETGSFDSRTHKLVDSAGETVLSMTTVAPLGQTFITSLTAATT